MQIENYYEEENATQASPKNKNIIFLVIGIIIVLILAVLFLLPLQNQDKLNITSDDQDNLSFSGSLVLNNELVDTFSNSGRILTHTSNPNESRTITMNLNNSGIQFDNARVVVTNSNGKIVANIPPELVTINPDGTISFDVTYSDLGIDPEIIGNDDDGTYEFNFQIIASNDDESDILTIVVPYQVMFEEFTGTGCLLLSRGAVTESTHFGQIEIPLTIRLTCNNESDLEASVNWVDKISGNVEIVFSNGNNTLLTPNTSILKENPAVGDYKATIYYTPKDNSKGTKTKFNLNFKVGNSEKLINFNVLNENLEQCVGVKTLDDTIENESDSASIEIDASKCGGNVNIVLCDADNGCSGGADEGTVNLSQSFFTLSKTNSKKTIKVTRNDIPGIYGVSVHASVPGISKVFIAEKEIFVKPTTEIFSMDKYSVSMFDSTRDTIRVKHSELAEDIDIDAGVCDLYKSSSGSEPGSNTITNAFSSEESWAYDLYNNSERYAGSGFYQLGFGKTIPYIDSVRKTAQLKAYGENAQIKLAYQLVNQNQDKFIELVNQGKTSVTTGDDLDSAMNDLIDIGDADIAINIASIGATLLGLTTDALHSCTVIHALSLENEAFLSDAALVGSIDNCAKQVPQTLKTAAPTLTSAMTSAESVTCGAWYTTIIDAYDAFNALKSAYDLIDQSTKDTKDMDVGSSLTNISSANKQIDKAKANSDEAIYYIDLALQEISLDSFGDASKDTTKAQEYLSLALAKNNLAKEQMGGASLTALKAGEDLTSTIPDKLEEWEKVNATIAATEGLIKIFAELILKTKAIDTSLKTATTQLGLIETALVEDMAQCSADCGGTLGNGVSLTCITGADCSCIQAGNSSYLDGIEMELVAGIVAEQSELGLMLASMSLVTTLGILQQSLTLYNSSLQDDVTSAYAGATKNTQGVIDLANNLLLELTKQETYLQNAIASAKNLALWENTPSELTTYTKDFELPTTYGEYDRERLNGLISSFILSGFVSGAYDGGVYTTTNTNNSLYGTTVSAKENEPNNEKIYFSDSQNTEKCSNRISLKLPDYKINLLQDAKAIESSNPQVMANWAFNNAKTFGVYEGQEVGITIAKNGLKENSYTTLTLNATTHKHEPLTIINGDFGPFNIPDKEVTDTIEKFHIKVNVKPRVDYSNISDATCTSGLFIGDTTSTALPKTILGWNWEDISSKTSEGKYLDATQFSILLSKKLSLLNEFLSSAQTFCPPNYAYDALTKMTHNDFAFSQTPSCFLPLTTKYYDNKPALYYHLENLAFVPQYYDYFFDETPISNADQMLGIIDFNVLLMRDGYGTEFQSDFGQYYSQTFLQSSPAFTDTRSGMHTYFKNNKKFYFTNETENFLPSQDFVIQDSGLYQVKIVIDFDSLPLISGGAPTAKIYVDLHLLEPIKEDFSPFYYTPFDGSVGVRIKNDRRFYGTSSNNSTLKLLYSESATIDNEQKDSLKQINVVNLDNFFGTNSSAKNRSKILEYGTENVFWSPTIATPLLFEINSNKETESSIFYWLKKDDKDVPSIKDNLLLLTALDKCKDFSGDNMLDYINQTPDFKLGLNYGFGFPPSENSGKAFVKTVVYSPPNAEYSLSYPENMIINTTNSKEKVGSIPFEGIKGMPYNDLTDQDYINSIKSLFDAVENESVCVARSSGKEIYYWSEQYLYERENSDGLRLIDEINKAKALCIK